MPNVPNASASLTPKQLRAIDALCTASTVEGAASEAKIGRATLYRWLADPLFARGYRQEVESRFRQASTRAQLRAEKALDALASVVEAPHFHPEPDPDEPPPPLMPLPDWRERITAANHLLTHCLRLRDSVELAGRVAELEAQLNALIATRACGSDGNPPAIMAGQHGAARAALPAVSR